MISGKLSHPTYYFLQLLGLQSQDFDVPSYAIMGTGQKSTSVKDLRTQVKLSRAEVAVALGMKTEKTVARWERGEAEPNLTPRQTAKLLQLYQCSLSELVQAFDELETSKDSTESTMLEPSFS